MALNYLSIQVFVGFLFCLAVSQNEKSSYDGPNIQAYLDGLSESGYDPLTPPEGNNGYGSPVEVLSTMFVLDIHRVDDINKDYRAEFYFRQSWNDSRLQFAESENLKSIILKSVDNIWTPDLFFIEEKEGIRHKIMNSNLFCRIQPNGEVLYSTRLSITFSCPMDLRKYPHDTQKCTFNIESYGFTKAFIELNWDNRKPEPISASEHIDLYDFELKEIQKSRREISLSFGEFTSLQVTFTFQRKTGFFFTRLYVPFIILIALSWASFWIKPKQRSLRLALLLVILYLMIILGSEINEIVPPTAYTKGSDVWIAVCETMVFVAFLELIVVSLLSQKEHKLKKKHCRNDVEVASTLEAEVTKVTVTADSLNSTANIVAYRLKGDRKSVHVENICKVVYPIAFVFFNIVYWSIYCSG